MSIPASGPISMSMFNTELGRTAAVVNTRLANGETPGVGSIFYLAALSGSNPPDQSAPHSFSELYGYTADLTTFVYRIEAQVNDAGNCSGSGNFSNAFFEASVPNPGSPFTNDFSQTVFKVVSAGFLNSGSDVTFNSWTAGNCSLIP